MRKISSINNNNLMVAHWLERGTHSPRSVDPTRYHYFKILNFPIVEFNGDFLSLNFLLILLLFFCKSKQIYCGPPTLKHFSID